MWWCLPGWHLQANHCRHVSRLLVFPVLQLPILLVANLVLPCLRPCGCRYDVRSPHRIALTFQEAQLGGVRISPLLETLLAPAVLPRGDLSMRLLMGLQEVRRLLCGCTLLCCNRSLRILPAQPAPGAAMLRPLTLLTPNRSPRHPLYHRPHPLPQFDLRVPFRSAQQVAVGRTAASYLLTYLDGDMLIGRASVPTGTFIFARVGDY